MGAGYVAERVGAGQYGQAEGQCDAKETDAQRVAVTAELGGEDGAATAAENQPESAEEFGGQTLAHAH
ncbi:hypothetical protein D9M71_763050 [compost metagenome]